MSARLRGRIHPGGVLMSLEIDPPTVRERNKYEAAAKAGLLERVLEVG